MPPPSRPVADPAALAAMREYLADGEDDSDSLGEQPGEDEEELMEDMEGLMDEEEEDVHPDQPNSPFLPPLPPNLREISSLASWTVSSSKPGCSIPQLRSPSTSQFWQSDGPQPHMLNIHFFKQVSIVGMRLYLDFDADESYTPTRILFLAGTGYNDLVEWAEMRLEQPRGWIEVDMSGVGRWEVISDDEGIHEDEEDADNDMTDNDAGLYFSDFSSSGSRDSSSSPTFANDKGTTPRRRRRRKGRRVGVLRAHLVQVKILENHQNGKDTHLRGLQIFARDKSQRGTGEADAGMGHLPNLGHQGPTTRNSLSLSTQAHSRSKGTLGDWGEVPDLR